MSFELTTLTLARLCSTPELRPRCRFGGGGFMGSCRGPQGEKDRGRTEISWQGAAGPNGPWQPFDTLNGLGCWLARARWLVLARDRAGLGVRGGGQGGRGCGG